MSDLKRTAVQFKQLLVDSAADDPDAARLLEWLLPLFDEVENGKTVSKTYEFRSALGRDSDFYVRHRDIDEAETKFIAVLERWRDKDWYKSLS